MKILFLQQQPCIRALKYAEGLRSTKDDVKLIFAYTHKTLTQFYGYGDELFDRMIKLEKKKLTPQIRKLIYTENIDIVHSHNAPDFLTLSAIEASRGRIPIIHDIHDLISIRNTPYGTLDPKGQHVLEIERRAVTECNGLIFVTSGVKDACESAYPIDQKPTLVFPNYVPRRLMPSALRRKLSENYGEIHIVYEGSLDSVNLGGHYDLKDIFKAIADQEIHIHIYSSKENPDYNAFADGNSYIHYHGHLDTKKLLQEITQYDYGWAGFNTARNKEHVDTVLSNKVLEYISCGLPVISFGHKTQQEFIEENGIGIVIDEIGELSSRLREEPELNKIGSRVLECRQYFTIEDKIRQVLDFYKSFT
jgi:glycosyltransferase involved in cell wall biosynthesis